MRLAVYKTLWGAVGTGTPYPTFDEVIPAVARDGFDGVAFALFSLQTDPDIGTLDRLRELRDEHKLEIVTLVQTSGTTVADHIASLRADLNQAEVLGSRHIVCLGGLDAFDTAAAEQFFTEALAMERDLGLRIAHETHRHRILYNPWTTARMLDRFEDLKLAVDFSHWVVVAERLIDDQLDIIRQAADRAIHIDARVGHPEGPQVPDPRAPEWEETLEAHLRWWEIVWKAQAAKGLDESITVPEFGAPPYQQTLPYTGAATSDLWEICNWMADVLRYRFMHRSDG